MLPLIEAPSSSLENPVLRGRNGIYAHHGAPFAITYRRCKKYTWLTTP